MIEEVEYANMIRISDYPILIPKELEPLIPGFISRRIEDMETLKSLISDKQFTEIASVGHRLRGHGSSYGFEAISVIGEKIENAAKKQDDQKTTQLIQNYHCLVIELKQSYDK